MSVEAMSWALSLPIGGARKLVLVGLGNHAHADGQHAFPAVETLARYAHVDRRTAQRALRWLAAEKIIHEAGKGPNGQVSYRLSMSPYRGAAPGAEEGGDILPPAAPVSPGGDTQVLAGAAPTPPEPSITVLNRPVVVAGASAMTSDVVGALMHAGFDSLTIEQYRSAIESAVQGFPPDVDWYALGVQMEARRRSGDIKSKTPAGALKWMAAAGLPRIGMPAKADRPLFGDRPLTADQRRHRRTRARIEAEGAHRGA